MAEVEADEPEKPDDPKNDSDAQPKKRKPGRLETPGFAVGLRDFSELAFAWRGLSTKGGEEWRTALADADAWVLAEFVGRLARLGRTVNRQFFKKTLELT